LRLFSHLIGLQSSTRRQKFFTLAGRAHNNEGENSLRGLCIGRRNWLFCGSDRGGRAAAIHFSLLASCKRHGHDPWVYLRDVLTRLPAMLPGASDEDLLSLLPHLWKPV
jgi:transposase